VTFMEVFNLMKIMVNILNVNQGGSSANFGEIKMKKSIEILLLIACLAALGLVVYRNVVQFGRLIPAAITFVIAMAVVAFWVRFES